MIQTATFYSSAFLLGYYILKFSEAATIEKSKVIPVSEILQLYPIFKAHICIHK